MKILEDLLDNYFITKKDNYSKFYDIQDNLKDLQEFIKEDLGYNIIKNNQVINLVTIPAYAKDYMGISSFISKTDYILFTLLLMYLEDKQKGDEFILSNLTDYIKYTLITFYPDVNIDFTKYDNRKSLVRVLKFAVNIHIIILHDGNEENFSRDEKAEVLYEVTGISRYFLRNFGTDLSNLSYLDIIEREGDNLIFSAKDKQRHRVYRRLLTEPVIYSFENEEDFEYIKANRDVISKKISKYLDAELYVHKNMAYLLLNLECNFKSTHPNIRTISDITLLFSNYLREQLLNNNLNYNKTLDTCDISRITFEEYILDFRNKFQKGFSIEFKEMNDKSFILALIGYMLDYKYICFKDDMTISILPITFKLIGRYPSDFSLEDTNDTTDYSTYLDNSSDTTFDTSNIQENDETLNVSPDTTKDKSDDIISLFDLTD